MLITMNESKDRLLFINYFNKLTIFNPSKFDEKINNVYIYAINYGLSEEDMSIITETSFQHNLGVKRVEKLMKCLIPEEYVSDKTLQNVLMYLTINKDALNVRLIKIILHWLIGVIELNLIKSTETINLYYDLFFYFLKFDIICIPASKLIYLLTKCQDVSRWYTKQVLKVHKLNGGAKYTGALLYLFKCYRPDVVPEKIPAYPVNKAFGVLMKSILHGLYSAKNRIGKREDIAPRLDDNIIWIRYDENIKYGSKSIQLIPSISGNDNLRDKSCISLLSILKIDQLHKYHLTSNSANCVLSLLNNSAGLYILIFSDKLTQAKTSYQLYSILYDAFINRNPNISFYEKKKLLIKLNILQNIVQQGLPIISKFIAQFIIRWDGFEFEDEFYDLMAWLHVSSYEELNHCILNYIYDIFICSSVPSKCKILLFLANLTVNFVNSHYYHVEKKVPYVFSIERESNYSDILNGLYSYIYQLCSLALYMDNCHQSLIHTVLIVHEKIFLTETQVKKQEFFFSLYLGYAALFSNNPYSLIRTCRLFNEYPKAVTNVLKQDYINCLWNFKAFEADNKYSIFNHFNQSQILEIKKKYNISNLLMWDNHFALACYNFLKQLEDSENIDDIDKTKIAQKNYLDICVFIKNNL